MENETIKENKTDLPYPRSGNCVKCGMVTDCINSATDEHQCIECTFNIDSNKKKSVTSVTKTPTPKKQSEPVAKAEPKAPKQSKTSAKRGTIMTANQVEQVCDKCGEIFINSKFTKYITSCKPCRGKK